MTTSSADRLCDLLAIRWPIIQAPMAGVSTPAMAAAVANAGGLGSIAVGATDADGARAMIAATKAKTDRSINVNVFCHRPAVADTAIESAWLARLNGEFARFNAAPPARLTEIYTSFVEDDAMLAVLLDARPKVVSLHFGLPADDRIAALRAAGIRIIASATTLKEARAAMAAGVDAIVAQGFEAGGHRGVFDPGAEDDRLGALALTRVLARDLAIPIIAAGGVMDGAGVAAALRLGAGAAQLGTAFIGCPESLADDAYRAALLSEAAYHTVMTRVISGRPARCLANKFTRFGAEIAAFDVPAYPLAYAAGRALLAAAKAAGEEGYAPHWAGQGAPLSRALPAADLMTALVAELAEA